MKWTPERIEEMLSLHYLGHTGAQIAQRFGTTRNAILGKIHRELIRRGLRVPNKRPIATAKPRRKSVPTVTEASVNFLFPAYISPTAPKEGQPASIVDVTGCRYPIADDPEMVGGVAFCNRPTGGHTYCPDCRRIVVARDSRDSIRRTIAQALYVMKGRAA